MRKPLTLIKPIIITSHMLATLASWIDQKDGYRPSSIPFIFNLFKISDEQPFYDRKNNPYNFNLIYRSNLGIGRPAHPEDVKELFKGKHPTVVFIRPRNSSILIGGYNSYPWRYNNKYFTPQSFLFSFENPSSLTGNIVRPNNNIRVEVGSERYNFGFGYHHGCWAFGINSQLNTFEFSSDWGHYPDAEEKLNLGNSLRLSGGSYQCEIYQVIKKIA